MDNPKYNRCDSCGRNAHKVALRHFVKIKMGSGEWTRTRNTTVEGYCTACFEDMFVPRTWNDGARHIDAAIANGVTRVYDHRGAASKKRHPMPAEMVPGYKPEPAFETTETNGRRVWVACGHPAERDANDHCLTCEGSL